MGKIDIESLLELLNEIDVKKEGLKEITEALLNWIMQKEREYFLQKQKGNKANGYYKRGLIPIRYSFYKFSTGELLPSNFFSGNKIISKLS